MSFGKSNSPARGRRKWLVKHWGQDGIVHCVYCGIECLNIPGPSDGKPPPNQLTADRIVTATGRYERGNVVPSCRKCNTDRGEIPFFVWTTQCGVNGEDLIAKAKQLGWAWEILYPKEETNV